MSWSWKKFTFLFLAGAAFLVIGLVFVWYPPSVIGGLEEQLRQAGLTQNEQDRLQGSLNWWKWAQVTTYQPLSNVLVAIGLVVIGFSVAHSFFSIWYELSQKRIEQTKKEVASKAGLREKMPSTNSFPTTRTKTGFPIAGGILAIIASCACIIFAVLGIMGFVLTLSYRYYSPYYWALLMGISGAVAFAFGLTGGIMSLKRKHFVLALIGACFLLLQGFITILAIGIEGIDALAFGILVGTPTIVLSVLSLIFIAISNREFS